MKMIFKNNRFFAFYVSVFTITVLFLIGCNESMQSKNQRRLIRNDPLRDKAEQVISQALADRDPRIRANAIEVVADTKQTAFLPKVKQLLNDEFVPVRFAAALAIGDSGYTAAKSSLRQLLTDEPNVRIAAAYALSKLGGPYALKIVRDAVRSQDQTVRANAVFLLGKSGNQSVLKPLLWAQLNKDSVDSVKLQALEARAKLKDERALDKLWATCFSSYADDRIIAVKAMGGLGTEKAKQILMTKLDDDVLEVRLVAAEQLGILGDTTGVPEVLDVFTKDLRARLGKSDLERVNILTALAIGQIKTPILTKFLPQLLKNKSKLVRIAAAKAVLQTTKRRNIGR